MGRCFHFSSKWNYPHTLFVNSYMNTFATCFPLTLCLLCFFICMYICSKFQEVFSTKLSLLNMLNKESHVNTNSKAKYYITGTFNSLKLAAYPNFSRSSFKFWKNSSEAAIQRCLFPRKKCSENMQQISRRTPMPKCDFSKVAAYFRNTFSRKHLWMAASA